MSDVKNHSAELIAFRPVVGNKPVLLVLGSMPGNASLHEQQYYAHPRNAFWPIVCDVFDSEAHDYTAKIALLKHQQIALWDVLKRCRRPGSLDADIQADSIVCNNFAAFLNKHNSIRRIAFNGKTAQRLFMQKVVPTLPPHAHLEFNVMPSTSPAMASLNLTQKTQIWREVLCASR